MPPNEPCQQDRGSAIFEEGIEGMEEDNRRLEAFHPDRLIVAPQSLPVMLIKLQHKASSALGRRIVSLLSSWAYGAEQAFIP
jgi:hypothetical protein